MFKNYLLSLMFISCPFHQCLTQQFRNGDFENVSAQSCVYNLSDVAFNKRMAYVYAFGKNNTGRPDLGQIDIHTFNCFVDPQSNKFCIGLAGESYTGLTSDAVAIELDNNLEPGETYSLKFYLFGNTTNHDTLAEIYIGESLHDSAFGIFIDTANPQRMVWKGVSKIFKATQNSRYITIKNKVGHRSWNQIDNFSLSHITRSANYSDLKSPIYLSPNPCHERTEIRNLPESKKFYAEIFDTHGRFISKLKRNPIDLTGCNKGLYIVKIYLDDKVYFSPLLVI